MLDLHTHVLPGIDDGARDLNISLALCRMLVNQGITEIVATPHWCSPRFEVQDQAVLTAWEKLSVAVTQEIPHLRLHLGSEHHLSGLQSSAAFVESLRPLGDTRCVLIEFPDDHLPENSWKTLHAVMRAGFIPIIAHPERCRGLVRAWKDIQAFTRAGGRLQFDLGNLLGEHGWMMRWRARRMFSRFIASSIIASDCHNLGVRKPLWDRLPAAWRAQVPQGMADLVNW